MFELEHHCVTSHLEPTGTCIESEHRYSADGQELLRSVWRMHFSAESGLQVHINVQLAQNLPPLPRVGVQLQLSELASQALETVTWFGRGPHENYPDRKTSADIGCWTLPLAAMHTDYIFPTDNGLRCDVSQLQLGQLNFSGQFQFSVSPYGQAQLAQATHTSDLEPAPGVYVYLDGYHMGVGGDDSWTPSCKEKYRLTARDYNWAFTLN